MGKFFAYEKGDWKIYMGILAVLLVVETVVAQYWLPPCFVNWVERVHGRPPVTEVQQEPEKKEVTPPARKRPLILDPANIAKEVEPGPEKKLKTPNRVPVSKTLLANILMQESGGDDTALGDYRHGEYQSYGCMQIQYAAVLAVNGWYGTNYTHEDMFDRKKAWDVADKYLGVLGYKFQQRTGRRVTNWHLAMMYNGGPRGAEPFRMDVFMRATVYARKLFG